MAGLPDDISELLAIESIDLDKEISDKKEALERVVEILKGYLHQDKSRIVKTLSMQALADLVEQDSSLLPKVIELLEKHTRTGSPAMQSRGRKLLVKLKSKQSSAA